MRRVAYLTSAHLFEEPCPDPASRREHDLQLAALAPACAARGIELRPLVWSEPGIDPSGYEAFVLATTWDYAGRAAEFLARLESWSRVRPLFNPLATVRWNLEKTYLRELAARGVPVVPTLWRERADAASIAGAFDELGAERVVVKPVVGQNSWRQVLLARGEALPEAGELPPAAAMIQPFLPSIEREGELSLLCFDRRVSHALRKRPRAGDYRIQATFGGWEEPCEPTEGEGQLAHDVLAEIPGPLLYARVDLVRGLDGEPAVMELELIEPYLYPEQGGGQEGLGKRYARALEGLLDAQVGAPGR